ncbi:uncharacterized protein BJ212DRAFT_342673 [Suillus subaureus]|uniref:DUF6533 domain-containing protein n=1 Tax=Suillus subaureus TaxID=48587 RepID=A0A9P7E9D4_9AGAM|nr:uncharacterized protein BJ212DRAFT_342673 [Suillus subaureus]KAG1814621.1 hypothetical protein BJ212DRAFT_342673 [Suillus subaureus]
MAFSPANGTMQIAISQIKDYTETRQTIYVGFAGFTILVWDHLVTSGDEIEFIWNGPKGILVYLFLLNRYLTPLGFIVNLVAYNLSSWSYTHFVRYEGVMVALGIEIVGLMMLIRVVAIYRYHRAVIVPAVFLLLAWIVVTAWLLSNGGPVTHVNNIHSCTMVFNSGHIASASAWLPLLYDTYVFGLTFKRTFSSIRNREAGHIIRTLFADGLLYYSVICTVNLVLTIMIIKSDDGVKNIAAQLELLLTVTMMSRITLNLKKEAYYGPSHLHLQAESAIMSTCHHVISTPSGEVFPLSRIRSHSAARAELSSRARSGSTSSLSPPVRVITFAETPTISGTRISDAQSLMSSSPVSEHADWPSASNSNKWNTADIV